jgi:hypothetical protein
MKKIWVMGLHCRVYSSDAKDLNVDVLVTLDSDGQHDPAEIPSWLRPIAEDQQMIYRQ